MEKEKTTLLNKSLRILTLLVVWAAIAWLLYPLIFKIITPATAKEYFFRSAIGVILMIIMFGKTLFDLLFPAELSGGKNALNVAILSIYTMVMAGGIIFMLIRILALYLNKNSGTYTGGDVQI